MKKFLSLILALAMVACMSVTAFAADDPTTTLTAEIPKPSYSLNIPANMTLKYGNTGMQTIGDVSVTDVKNYEEIIVKMPYTDLVNINDNTDKIPLTLYVYTPSLGDQYLNYNGLDEYNTAWYLYYPHYAGLYQFDSDGYTTLNMKAQVSDGTGATSGATYQATITYVVAASNTIK